MNKSGKKSKFWSICAYSAADMLGGGVGQVISLYYLTFLTFVVQLPAWQAGLVTGIGKVWDGITDPLMGVIVDKTRSRFGSCRLWMTIAVIPVFVTYFMLWYSFGISSPVGKFVYYAFAYMLWSTAFTVAVIPYEALLPKIVSSYKERTNYSSARMIFSGIACVASTYIYEFLVPVTAETPLSPALTPNFAVLGLVLGAFFALPLIITVIGTKEKNIEKKTSRLTVKGIFKDYKEVLKSKIYRKYYALGLSGTFVGSAISASMVMFVYLVYGNVANFLLGFTLVFVIVNLKGATEIAFFVPNMAMMKKVNKHRPYLIDIPLIIIAAVIVLFVDSSVPIWVFLVAMGCLGAGVSCLGFVPMTLLPDLSDVDELVFGKRREGVNAGLTTLGKKLVGGLSITVFGLILEAFGLDTSNASPSAATPETITAIKIMFCVVPIVFCSLMLILSFSYNLDEKRHNMIKRLIKEKRETGVAEPTSEEITACEKITGVTYDKMWISKPALPDEMLAKNGVSAAFKVVNKLDKPIY